MMLRDMVILIAVVLLAGCAGTMPYDSDFTCPQMEKGVCGSTESVYSMAMSESDNRIGRKPVGYQAIHREAAAGENLDKAMTEAAHQLSHDLLSCMNHRIGQAKCISDAKLKFENTVAILEAKREKIRAEKSERKLAEELRRKMLSSLVPGQETSQRTLRTKPKIIRVMFLPYRTKNDFLAGTRYNWMVVDFGKWVFATN